MGDHVGEQLGNYHLLRLLGRGGFAEVYLGEHLYLQNRAAVKVLHTRLSEEEAARFVTEARTLARLSHPHIVRVLDFAMHEGIPFLVMEFAPGGSLRTRHPAGTRLPLETIVSYVSQVASALQYAHDQRLMHRDVKPENMLLDAREQVLLADFGLALLLPTHPASTQALDPALAGTAPYLAPETGAGHTGTGAPSGARPSRWRCSISQPHRLPSMSRCLSSPLPSRRSSCMHWPKSQRNVSPPCRTLRPLSSTLLLPPEMPTASLPCPRHPQRLDLLSRCSNRHSRRR